LSPTIVAYYDEQGFQMLFRHRLPATNFCFLHREGALPAIAIAHPAFSASVLLQGAQLVRFTLRGESNWLWLSEEEPFLPGQAVRGGIPLCWPWFGDPRRNPEPVRQHIRTDQAHGLARQADWQLYSIQESAHEVVLALTLNAAQLPGPAWSGQARVTATFRFSGRALTVALETCNTGTETLHFSQALHSYFPTADIRQTRIHGLNGQRYVDALDDWRTKVQRGPVHFRAETDRIYSVADPLQLVTPAGVMRLQQREANSAVIWNPWQKKALRLSHFAPAAWQRVFCVETANALDDAVCAEPGKRHTMGFHLSRLS
jgi:glucose-6-phosphate 1-epimerase